MLWHSLLPFSIKAIFPFEVKKKNKLTIFQGLETRLWFFWNSLLIPSEQFSSKSINKTFFFFFFISTTSLFGIGIKTNFLISQSFSLAQVLLYIQLSLYTKYQKSAFHKVHDNGIIMRNFIFKDKKNLCLVIFSLGIKSWCWYRCKSHLASLTTHNIGEE